MINLLDSLMANCDKCNKTSEHNCKNCFFFSLDFDRIDLGSKYNYRKAYYYLKQSHSIGYKKRDMFGERLNIKLKENHEYTKC